MQGFVGWALFVDGSDMLCRADLSEIMEHADWAKAVHVVKHDYKTKHPRKYIGTAMESDNPDYDKKQFASAMLINCSHFAWRKITPEYVAAAPPMHLLQLGFIADELVGTLPEEWNWLVDEKGPNDQAKLIHFTAGIPAFSAYRESPMADEWHAAIDAATSATG
jgi:hypothetical protein